MDPFTIAIDTREQRPYEFPGAERMTLPTGDYSIVGLEDQVAIERKSKTDAYSSLGQARARFRRELERLAKFDYAAIVVEDTVPGFLDDEIIVLPPAGHNWITTWSGEGETQAPWYELMSLYVDGNLVGSAHAPGGGLGCDGGMAPVVSDPAPPQQVTLQPGTHPLFIDATTNDPLYHLGAWYRFDLSFADAPQ